MRIRQTKYWCDCFFFQAEDGMRDIGVTGVQTCALPISGGHRPVGSAPPFDSRAASSPSTSTTEDSSPKGTTLAVSWRKPRSEERRVEKECRSRWSPYH